MARLASFCVVLLSCFGSPALAQPPRPTGATTFHSARVTGDTEVRLSNAWTAPGARGRRAEVRLTVNGGEPTMVHRGDVVRTSLALGHGRALVAMIHGGRQPFVRVVLAPLAGDGGGAARPLQVRAGQGGFTPTSVVTCADPDGFTIVWQEQGGADPRSGVRAYMGRVAPDGRWIQRPAVVQIPWALAGIAWNGRGYHLALFFDGARPTDTRLSMVTLNPGGVPEQHPWWASSPQMIDEVQLVPAGGRIVAFFRGGADGTALKSADVTDVGQWGQDPGNEQLRVTLGPAEEFAIRVKGAGGTEVVRRAANAFP